MVSKRIFVIVMLLVLAAFAEESAGDSLPYVQMDWYYVDSLARVDSLEKARQDSIYQWECIRSIPLPRQTAFQEQGISVGIAAGLYNPTEKCDCLGLWQGQLEYHYSEKISSGLDVRFFGGDLDADVMLLYQRYRLNVRFHKSNSFADGYVSPVLGLETTDISTFRDELRGKKNDDDDSLDSTSSGKSSKEDCEKMFSLSGFTIGVEVGGGLVLWRYVGLTGNAVYEYNFAKAQMLTLTPGFAFNLREVAPWAKRNLLSTWVSAEVSFQRYFNRGVSEWAVAFFLGLQMGI